MASEIDNHIICLCVFFTRKFTTKYYNADIWLCDVILSLTFDQRVFEVVLKLSVLEILIKSYLASNFWFKFINCGVQIDINASFASHNVNFLANKTQQQRETKNKMAAC